MLEIEYKHNVINNGFVIVSLRGDGYMFSPSWHFTQYQVIFQQKLMKTIEISFLQKYELALVRTVCKNYRCLLFNRLPRDDQLTIFTLRKQGAGYFFVCTFGSRVEGKLVMELCLSGVNKLTPNFGANKFVLPLVCC